MASNIQTFQFISRTRSSNSNAIVGFHGTLPAIVRASIHCSCSLALNLLPYLFDGPRRCWAVNEHCLIVLMFIYYPPTPTTPNSYFRVRELSQNSAMWTDIFATHTNLMYTTNNISIYKYFIYSPHAVREILSSLGGLTMKELGNNSCGTAKKKE